MTDYDELVKALREHKCDANDEDDTSICAFCAYEVAVDNKWVCVCGLMNQAANAIEELSRIERDFRQYISDQVKREKGVYACCYCKNRESANKYEPGCIHEECDGVSGWKYGTPKEET